MASAFTVTGSPTQAFVDAVQRRLVGSARVQAIAKVFGFLSEAQRTAYPYVYLGRRNRLNDGGAMTIAGGHVSLQLDVWSAHKGASEVHAILSVIAMELERAPLPLQGFTMIGGSLTCEMEEVFDEPDADKPGNRLYHGVQRWVADIEENAFTQDTGPVPDMESWIETGWFD